MSFPGSIADGWDTALFNEYNNRVDEATQHYEDTVNRTINALREQNLLVDIDRGFLKIRSIFEGNEENGICISTDDLYKTVEKYSINKVVKAIARKVAI